MFTRKFNPPQSAAILWLRLLNLHKNLSLTHASRLCGNKAGLAKRDAMEVRNVLTKGKKIQFD